MITDATLDDLLRLSDRCDPGPWVSVVEGRDAESGDSFLRTGPGDQRGEDLYLTRDSEPAEREYLDLVAAARTYLPLLIAELRALRISPSQSRPEAAPGESIDPVRPGRLILIGYWAGPETTGSWPSVEDFVDLGWDADDRSLVTDYLRTGQVARSYMGWSRCRLCGRNNGDLELSDDTYVWPDGLTHYVRDHGVRLPEAFVEHVRVRTESLERAERDLEWWRSAAPPAPKGVVSPTAELSAPKAEQESWTVIRPQEGPDVPVGRDHVVDVVDQLCRELGSGPDEEWENDTLERFLEAFGSLLAVIERSYGNGGQEVPTDPWVLMADALRGARNYE